MENAGIDGPDEGRPDPAPDGTPVDIAQPLTANVGGPRPRSLGAF